MIYHSYNLSKYIQFSLSVSQLFEVGCQWVVCGCAVSPCSYRLDRNGMLLKFLHVLITHMYFKDRNWISKMVNCINCSFVCKIVFCSEFRDISDNAGKTTRRRSRRRTQAIAKRYAFHTKTKRVSFLMWTL